LQNLGSLSGNTGNAEAYGINDAGAVVGATDVPDGSSHAFLWTTGAGMQDLGTLAAEPSSASQAFAINDSGEVAGYSATDYGSFHAFLWTAGGGMQDLGTLGGNSALNSEADYINAAGEVIGWSDTGKTDKSGNAIQDPFVWTAAGGMQDLVRLIGNTTWQIQSINGINDAGLIAGTAITKQVRTHAIVMAPLPVITVQPVSAMVAKGANKKLTVVVASTTALSYQWQKNGMNLKNSGNVSGVNTAMLTITTAKAANAGNYRVVVTNLAGAVTSSLATIKVK
jgi:probable HAF family extracellular repeat protein